MCIAILNKANITLSKDVLNESATNNPDGFGIAWTNKNKLHVFKTLSKKQFIKTYYQVRKECIQSNIVLHCRIKTSGQINLDNCHPFTVNKNLIFCHNGVISGMGNDFFSDTFEFNELLKKLKNSFIKDNAIRVLISKAIGHSKLIFLDNRNEFTIINDKLGHYDKSGNWYSNSSYKKPQACGFYYESDSWKSDYKYNPQTRKIETVKQPFTLHTPKIEYTPKGNTPSILETCDLCNGVSHKLTYIPEVHQWVCNQCQFMY